VDPCPVDCIIIQEVELTAEQTKQLAEIAKYRHKQKTLRKHQEQQLVLSYIAKEAEVSAMQQEIAQIVERQKNKPNNFKIYGQEE
jgi:formate hydrogenlyase subunit 6/NADH:ubiquinone oxidoreductase subunit I